MGGTGEVVASGRAVTSMASISESEGAFASSDKASFNATSSSNDQPSSLSSTNEATVGSGSARSSAFAEMSGV